jgi:hypothetical protein
MKISGYSLIAILTCVTYISFFGSSYASTDSSIWYRYTIQEQSNGTSGETYSHMVDIPKAEGFVTTEGYPVSGNAVPWSNTVPPNLSGNHTEYCAMSTAIRQYFQNLGIIPNDIRFNQYVNVGHDYGSPTNTHVETDFFVVLGSTKYNSTMMNLGFYMADSRYELNSQSLLDCNNTMSSGVMPILNVTGTNYFMPYAIENGKVINATADIGSKSIAILVNTTNDGSITVTIPRTLLDSKAGNSNSDNLLPFVVTRDGTPVSFQESENDTSRTIKIPWSGSGIQSLKISSTLTVPEFPFSVQVLMVGIVSGIIFYRMKFRK